MICYEVYKNEELAIPKIAFRHDRIVYDNVMESL